MSHRVVLDTNCVISALLFSQQKMAWLRHGWQSGDFVPLVNKQTASELLRVLTHPKFKLTKAEQALLLADFLPYTEIIPVLEAPIDLPIIRDSADQKFLELLI
ncbi:putative toxin-antitoxin system toxin component, PIN family [Methyloglobulus sp.]|uniref:putative toxin-antitoxin system toxin component, PIN family n=1 Tax=Methyloglobulus sp. TaxID=2518622 RepID=UPI0039899058